MTYETVRRLPKLYKEASKILQKVKEEGGSLKSLVFGSRHPNLKALYALVLETLKHGQQLDHLIRKTQVLLTHPRLNPWVARILMTELLWQKKALSAVSPPQEIVLSYHEQFLSELATVPKDAAYEDASNSSKQAQQVRFVRVNTLKSTVENVVSWFKDLGWEEIEDKRRTFVEKAQSLTSSQFMRDGEIPDLLVFPQDFKFYETELYDDGVIILQDKASCVPPIVLNPPPGSVVLDMCAAPGMKTTQAAAIVGPKGKVLAVEINKRRFDSLCDTVEKCGAGFVKCINGDVLHQSDQDMQDVEYIILDPPCSGSGMLCRQTVFGEAEEKDSFRLTKLANFQCSLLRHAMTNFPKVKRIVYSTCSIHPEENEGVVESVLKSVPPNFVPVQNPSHTDWMTRGSSDYQYGSCGFYARPAEHLTNGFFVILFERSEHEYESSSKPSRRAASIDAEETQDLEQKNKRRKRKKKQIDDQDPEDDIVVDKKQKKAETDDALHKMLKAMQKQSAYGSTQSAVSGGDDNQFREKEKKRKKKSKKETNETQLGPESQDVSAKLELKAEPETFDEEAPPSKKKKRRKKSKNVSSE